MDDILRFFEQRSALVLAIGGVVSALCAIVGVWFQWHKLKKSRNELQEQVGQLTLQLGQVQERHLHAKEDQTAAKEETQRILDNLKATQNQALEKEKELTEELENTREKLLGLEAKEKTAAGLVKRMLQLEGRLWEKRIYAGAAKFRPLAQRKTPIITVLNLKGGVGKTTLTAHLGGALAQRGYHPLLLDLDLQGSLSSMFLPLDKVVERSRESLLLQHFLSHAAHHRGINLLDYIAPILEDRAGLVATSDKMAYAELNLTMHWLLRLGKRDTRFLLRRALHQKRITNRFDIVLLDCPPLINTCCVNALAASDYVLIPVTPSKKSAERVPQLLKTIRDLSSRINPHIQVLGIVLNRTHGQNLTALELDAWKQLQTHCQDQWGSPVHACRTTIRHTTEVRESENQFTLPGPDSELYDTFRRLVLEIEERLPGECRRIATTSV